MCEMSPSLLAVQSPLFTIPQTKLMLGTGAFLLGTRAVLCMKLLLPTFAATPGIFGRIGFPADKRTLESGWFRGKPV